MSVTDNDKELLDLIKSHLSKNYDITRFLRDATQGLKNRQKNREKARKYWRKKYDEEDGIVEKTETNPQTDSVEVPKPVKNTETNPQTDSVEVPQKSVEPVPEVQEEKPRRPSLLNLAEIQAKFQQGLKDSRELSLPPLITDTKAKKK